MEIELNFRGNVSLMEFLGASQYDDIEIEFNGLNLEFCPKGECEIPMNFYSEDMDRYYMEDEKRFSIYFNEETPFISDELRFEDGEWIIKNYDELYPIIKAVNVHIGLLDEDYNEDIRISPDNELRLDRFLIQVNMDYLDGKYSIKDVQVIKDLNQEGEE